MPEESVPCCIIAYREKYLPDSCSTPTVPSICCIVTYRERTYRILVPHQLCLQSAVSLHIENELTGFLLHTNCVFINLLYRYIYRTNLSDSCSTPTVSSICCIVTYRERTYRMLVLPR